MGGDSRHRAEPTAYPRHRASDEGYAAARYEPLEWQTAAAVNAGTIAQVPSGNQVALNVGQGGPGTGRTVYRTGTQQMHGAPVQGQSPGQRDILSEFGREVTDKNTLVRK